MTKWFGIIVLILIAMLTVAWFAAAGLRADRAGNFDVASNDALNHGNLGRAYRQAEFAEALSGTDDRLLSLGSLAFLRQDYRTARRYFSAIGGGQLGNNASAGRILTAAFAKDQGAYQSEIDRPTSDSHVYVIKADAMLAIGDHARLAKLCTCTVHTRTMAYLTALGKSVDDPKAALQIWQAAPAADIGARDHNPAFAAMVANVTDLPSGDTEKISSTFQRMAQVTSRPTRQVLLAQLLSGQRRYQAAERYADEALAVAPKYRDGWNVLAAIQIGERNYAGAERSLHTSLGLDPAYGETWHLRAELAKARGDTAKQREYDAKARQLVQ